MNRILAAAVPVSTMAHVKLDILTKDFVVTVLQDSLVYTARNVIKHKTVRWTQYLMIIIEYSEG